MYRLKHYMRPPAHLEEMISPEVYARLSADHKQYYEKAKNVQGADHHHDDWPRDEALERSIDDDMQKFSDSFDTGNDSGVFDSPSFDSGSDTSSSDFSGFDGGDSGGGGASGDW